MQHHQTAIKQTNVENNNYAIIPHVQIMHTKRLIKIVMYSMQMNNLTTSLSFFPGRARTRCTHSDILGSLGSLGSLGLGSLSFGSLGILGSLGSLGLGSLGSLGSLGILGSLGLGSLGSLGATGVPLFW
jgi:hypothetical protein